MAVDPFLYLAFGAGFLLGRLPHRPTAWVARATLATVCALIFFLGVELGSVPGFDPLADVPAALVFVGLIVGFTLLASMLLPSRTESIPPGKTIPVPPVPWWIVFLAVLAVGFGVGRSTNVPSSGPLTGALYLLLALVAFDLHLSASGLRRLWAPLTAAAAGAVAGAVVFVAIDPVGWVPALATAFGFGWYSLAGPLVTARFGVSIGLLAFLTNFLREDLTFLLSPYIGRVVRVEGLVAMGGATSMDTTLYFAVRYGEPVGDPANGTLALASGLTLTVVASLVLPLLLGWGAG